MRIEIWDRVVKELEEKKADVEVLHEAKAGEDKNKISILIEPHLYRDMSAFMKTLEGSVDVEDQYGELTKGKPGEDDSTQQEFMQLIANYEKMHMEEEETKAKPAVAKPAVHPSILSQQICAM